MIFFFFSKLTKELSVAFITYVIGDYDITYRRLPAIVGRGLISTLPPASSNHALACFVCERGYRRGGSGVCFCFLGMGGCMPTPVLQPTPHFCQLRNCQPLRNWAADPGRFVSPSPCGVAPQTPRSLCLQPPPLFSFLLFYSPPSRQRLHILRIYRESYHAMQSK